MQKVIAIAIGLASVLIFSTLWIALAFGAAHLIGFAFPEDGALTRAVNKVLSAILVLLPGFVAYWVTQSLLRNRPEHLLSLSQKFIRYLKYSIVALIACAVIAYGDWASCDELSSCDFSEPAKSKDKVTTFLRLAIVSLLGISIAHRTQASVARMERSDIRV